MKHYVILYFSTLIIMVLLDLTWIGGIAREFYKNRIGSQLEFSLLPAVLFYLLYTAGVLIFVSGGEHLTWQSTALYGAALGFIAYMTYDLTNMATLRGWSPTLVVVDIAWGTFVTGFAATCGWQLAATIERHL